MTWYQLRDSVSADDTALTAFGYSNWPTTGVFNNLHQKMRRANAVHLMFLGTAAADKDAAYILYGRRYARGPILHLLSGIVTLGTQVVTEHPITGATSTALWADTITVTAGLLSQGDTIKDSGNNRIAEVTVDLFGIQDLYCQFDLDGGVDALTAVEAIITGA
jgi:hypothetical protein